MYYIVRIDADSRKRIFQEAYDDYTGASLAVRDMVADDLETALENDDPLPTWKYRIVYIGE